MEWFRVAIRGPIAAERIIHLPLLFLRVAVSLEIMIVHGLKKIGVGVAEAEKVPDPFNLPYALNQFLATSANLFFPLLVIIGLFTRLAILPTLAVTSMGYFVIHWNDSLIERDIPFMYTMVYLFLLFTGPGKYSIDYLIARKKYGPKMKLNS